MNNNNPPEKLNLSNCTVEQLRHKNVKVKIFHKRLVSIVTDGKVTELLVPKFELLKMKDAKINYVVNPTGGQTEMFVNYDGNEYVGRAKCSKTDNFSYRRSNSICLGRLELVKGSN